MNRFISLGLVAFVIGLSWGGVAWVLGCTWLLTACIALLAAGASVAITAVIHIAAEELDGMRPR